MTALTLLSPQTPMLFQGQEFAASAPFRYFSDHKPEISKLVLKGRAEFLAQFRSLRSEETQSRLADPGNPTTFESCKLDFNERASNHRAYALHKELLRLRREDPVLRQQGRLGVEAGGIDGAVLGEQAFVLRYFGRNGNDRLLLVNFGRDLALRACPEPLLAPPRGCRWQVMFSTEDPNYGGHGAYNPAGEGPWNVTGECAVLLQPVKREEPAAESKNGSNSSPAPPRSSPKRQRTRGS